MKRHTLIYIIAIVLIGLLLTRCDTFDYRDYIPGMWDLHKGERPTDYAPAKWSSENPNIWFEVPVPEDENASSQIALNGEIVLDDRTIQITVRFDPGRTIFVYNAAPEGGILFDGTCKFSSEKLIVKINKKSDTIFDGQYDKITFVKTATE